MAEFTRERARTSHSAYRTCRHQYSIGDKPGTSIHISLIGPGFDYHRKPMPTPSYASRLMTAFRSGASLRLEPHYG